MKRRKHFYKHVVINVRNKEEIQRVREKRNVVQTTKEGKANWIGRIFHRNCLLKHVIEGEIVGRIEVTGIRERRNRLLLGNLK
jgi:hypothetical protein